MEEKVVLVDHSRRILLRKGVFDWDFPTITQVNIELPNARSVRIGHLPLRLARFEDKVPETLYWFEFESLECLTTYGNEFINQLWYEINL